MKKLKIMTLGQVVMENREMSLLTGGCEHLCGCACAYAAPEAGGITVAENRSANYKGLKHSYGLYGDCPYFQNVEVGEPTVTFPK